MKIKIAVIGAGGRGMFSYAPYALNNSADMEITAVAEPKDFLREEFKEKYNLKPDMVFKCWTELLEKPKLADGLFICTQDNMHFEPAMKAIEKGYKYILLEKPISPSLEECKILAKTAVDNGVNIQVCHSLRYTPFYRKLKECIDSGIIGDLININHTEGVQFGHFSHSFVRGDWSNSDNSCPMILAKCCHDTDLLLYLTDRSCVNISSYGSLIHFKKENAPVGSADRCIDCKVKETCPYNAVRMYKDSREFHILAVEKEGFLSLNDAMWNGRYGRCAYKCDNNVVDHQVVNMLFDNDSTATLTLCAYEDGRKTYITGTKGKIYASFSENITVEDFVMGHTTIYNIAKQTAGHGGADEIMIRDFISMIENNTEGFTNIQTSVQSHAMCHAAEISRLEKRNVELDELL